MILFFVHANLEILEVIRNIETEDKRLVDKIKDQQVLFNKSECAFKKEVSRLKAQLEEGNKVTKQYKEREYQCQNL